jgi:hypothetical protein
VRADLVHLLETHHLPRSRRTRSLTALAATMTLGLAGAASANAALTIDSPVDGDYLNTVRPSVHVTGATPGDHLELDINNHDTGVVVVAGSDGKATLSTSASIVDPPVSATPGSLPITVIDTDGPEQTTIYFGFDTIPSISGTGDGSTVAAADVLFHSGSAIPDQAVRLYVDGAPAGLEFADDNGEVTDPDDSTHYLNLAPSNLAPGSHRASVVSVDGNGDESDHSDTVTFNVEPAEPLFDGLFDGAKLNSGAQIIALTGVYSAASRVTLYELDDNGDPVELAHTTAVGAQGAATIPVTLADGSHSLVVSQTVNGVESDIESDNTDVDVQSSAPVLDELGALINDATPWFDAHNLLINNINNNTKVKLYVDGVVASVDDNFGGGEDGLKPDAPISEGDHTAYVTTIDDLGHEGVASNTVSFTVDTIAPAIAFTAPAAGALTTATPVVTLHTEPGATVRAFADNDDLGTATADANGDVTFTVTHALSSGSHTLVAGAEDAAGNYSDDALRTVSYTAPAAATPAPVTPVTPATPQKSPAPAPAAPTTPAAPAKVSLSSHTLTAKTPVKVGFTLTRPGTVKLTLTKTVHGRTVTVATVTVRVTKAGKGSYTLRTKVGGHTLGKGAYRLTLQTVSGKKTSKKVSQALTVK